MRVCVCVCSWCFCTVTAMSSSTHSTDTTTRHVFQSLDGTFRTTTPLVTSTLWGRGEIRTELLSHSGVVLDSSCVRVLGILGKLGHFGRSSVIHLLPWAALGLKLNNT